MSDALAVQWFLIFLMNTEGFFCGVKFSLFLLINFYCVNKERLGGKFQLETFYFRKCIFFFLNILTM